MSHNQVSPLFDIWIDDDCKCIKMMLIGTQGKTRYYANLLEDHYINHQLPLSAGEYITTVKFVNTTLTVIGSSTGEVYLMNLESDSISTFYRHSMRLESFSFVNHFCIKSIPHASEEMALRFAPSRAINSIRVVANLCFVSDLETVSIWQIEDPNTVKVQ